jgi:macrolide-specific efflux system membrane fusion protein
MKNRRLIAAAAVLALLGGGAFAWKKLSKPKRFPAERHAVKAGAIESTVDATGAVAPLNRVEIKPPISGRVEQLLITEGQRVKAGQVLAWMSSSDRAAILDAARAQGEAELRRWQDSYKATPIVAPLSGLVILRNVVVGQTVDPGTVLYAMSDTLVVVAQVDESDVGRVQRGMPARVTLDSYPDRKVEGAVFDILFEGKNVSNVIQYGVKIKVDPVPDFFRSQMTANVSFILARNPKALLIPAAAVRDSGDGSKHVLVPGAEGEPPDRREIKTGVESGESVEVTEGLAEGDIVLVGRSRYARQQAASSPLMPGGRPQSTSGEAPRARRRGQGQGGQ